MTRPGNDPPVPGVRSMDHTADIGIEVDAPDLPELFRRAALGTLWMALERSLDEDASGSGEARELTLEADDTATLLRAWLREVLYWQEVEGYAVVAADVTEVSDGRFSARVRGVVAPPDPVREIKGVTWHGLEVGRAADGWRARVIFDV